MGAAVRWPCMKLQRDSADHRQIEYALHLAVGNAEVRCISAIDNPLARHQFGRRTSGVLKLHSFVTEDGGAAIEDGRLRWAASRSGSSGMLVHIGTVSPGVLGVSDDAGRSHHTLIYCLAAVGQAWPVDTQTLARCETEPNIRPPAGYDSFVLGEHTTDPGFGLDSGSWRHRWIQSRAEEDAASSSRPVSYWLTDRSQVLPLYVVEFDIPEVSLPTMATTQTTTCHIPGRCQYHDCPCEYYCPRCQTAMCAECKLTGHHSHGPALKHVLQPLQVAYRAAVQNSQDGANPMLLSAVANLDAARDSVRIQATKVRNNAADVRRNLAVLVAAINAQIDHAENCRLAALQSQEIELARQLRTLHAGEQFLRSQIDTVPMASFLQTWSTHVHSRTPMLSEGAPDLLLGSEMGGIDETTGVMGYEAHCCGTPAHAAETSDRAMSVSCGSSLVSFDSPSQASSFGSSGSRRAEVTESHGATPRGSILASCSSAVATALGDASPFPSLTLHGAVGLRVENSSLEQQHLNDAPCQTQSMPAQQWWEPPQTASDAMRAADAAACSTVATSANIQFAARAAGDTVREVQWGWCSHPCKEQTQARERAARLRSAFRNAAMAGGGASALIGHQGRGKPKPAGLSKSAQVIVGQTVNLASGKVNNLQSIEVFVSGVMNAKAAVRVEIRHGDAKSGGLGIGFGRYDLPYRYPAACTTDACAVQISRIVVGSVASLRPDLRVGSVLIGVNGKRVSTMRLEEVLKEIHDAEVTAAREVAGEPKQTSLTLDLIHEVSAPAMRHHRERDESFHEYSLEESQIQPPRPPPPFANRVVDQLNDVLSEVILEEQTAAAVRIQAAYRGGAERLDHRISHLAATMMQARLRGLRARKAVDAHRAALLAQEQQTQSLAESARQRLEQNQEQDRNSNKANAADGPVLTSTLDQRHHLIERRKVVELDDGVAPGGLGAKLQQLESLKTSRPEDSAMNISPRRLAQQLEEDERELGRIEARIAELSSGMCRPKHSQSKQEEREQEWTPEQQPGHDPDAGQPEEDHSFATDQPQQDQTPEQQPESDLEVEQLGEHISSATDRLQQMSEQEWAEQDLPRQWSGRDREAEQPGKVLSPTNQPEQAQSELIPPEQDCQENILLEQEPTVEQAARAQQPEWDREAEEPANDQPEQDRVHASKIPEVVNADQLADSPLQSCVSTSSSQSQSRRTERSPRILSTISASTANCDEVKHVASGVAMSKGHWSSLRKQVKKPGQSLLERMQQAAAEQASVREERVLQGEESPVSVPVRPPRPNRHGSKSRLEENRERMLRAE